MKKSIIYITLSLLSISCIFNKRVSIVGETENAKAGALVKTKNNMYYIDGLYEWEDNELNKKICVKGRLKVVIKSEEYLKYNQGIKEKNIIINPKYIFI